MTAEVEVPQGGGDGLIATLGGRFGGYGLYLLKGKPVFTYNFVDLVRFRWEGPAGADTRQAYHRIRFHLRWTRRRQERYWCVESGR